MATEPTSPLLTCYSEDLLPPGEALARLERAVEPLAGCESVPLAQALGRVLAGDVASPVDVPGHTNSAVDGYAVAGAGLPGSGTRGYELQVASALTRRDALTSGTSRR